MSLKLFLGLYVIVAGGLIGFVVWKYLDHISEKHDRQDREEGDE